VEIHLVTGASGRTGLALCAELKSRGLFVRAVCNNGAVRPYLEQYADEIVRADIRDPRDLPPVFDGVRYVYHLAGIVSIASKIDRELDAVNVQGMKHVIDACLAARVKRLIYTGTVHTLPFTDTTTVLREIKRYDPDAVDGAYAVTKSIASNMVLDAVREQGLDALIALPSGIVGAFELKRSNFGQIAVDVAEKRLPAYVTGRYDFVDVRDVSRALADLAEKGSAGESYILSGHIIEVKELVEICARAARVAPPRLCVPLGALKPFAALAEQIDLARKRMLTFTPYALKVLGDNCLFSHEKISALTGYAPRPVRDALEEQVDFYFRVYKPYFKL
jgi:dihydroflavonol-4-reductase